MNNFSYKKLDNNYIAPFRSVFAFDLLEGFSSEPKRLSSKYFYDDVGSKIFQEITELEEYYPTVCEAEILKACKEDIVAILPKKFRLIELGAGDGRKTNILLEHFLCCNLQFEYTPIDISEKALQILMESLETKFATTSLETHGYIADYFSAISWLANSDEVTNFVIFLGSNIGNFTIPETKKFLRYLWNSLNHGDYVLIGFDLKKDIDVLTAAYNDSKGVTKRFNLNLLSHINAVLGGNFELDKFRHFSHYNVLSGAMESWLISTEKQQVYIDALAKTFPFKSWEGIHTEYSYKYTPEEIQNLAQETGFYVEKIVTDQKGYFIDAIWKTIKK